MLTALFNCAPCDNCCYICHSKNPDDDGGDEKYLANFREENKVCSQELIVSVSASTTTV